MTRRAWLAGPGDEEMAWPPLEIHGAYMPTRDERIASMAIALFYALRRLAMADWQEGN